MRAAFDNASPIFEQIAAVLKNRIASGELEPGARVLPVRELALEFGANPNTVQRALAALEHEGLLYTERTAGRYVTEDREKIEALRGGLSKKAFERFIAEASGMGYTLEEAVGELKKHWKDLR